VPCASALDINPDDTFHFTDGGVQYYIDYYRQPTPMQFYRSYMLSPDQKISPFDDIYNQTVNCEHTHLTGDPTDPILGLFNNVFDIELMQKNLFLQNKSINKAIDYSASDNIYLGNNVDLTTGRYSIKQGDFVVNSGGNVRLYTKTAVHLKPGTKVNRGGRFLAAKPGTNNPSKSAHVYINTPEILAMANNSFKVKNYGPDDEFSWSVSPGNYSGKGKYFIPDSTLAPGMYNITCTLTRDGLCSSSTATVEIKNQGNGNFHSLIQGGAGVVYSPGFSVSPNPCHGTMEMEYTLNVESPIKIEVFNTSGVLLSMPVNARVPIGAYRVAGDVSSLKPGVYCVRYTTPSNVENKKVIVY
jgi:hypothetical protein